MVSITPEGRANPLNVELIVESDEAREEWSVGKRIHDAIVARRSTTTLPS
jgi:hypothetical protein